MARTRLVCRVRLLIVSIGACAGLLVAPSTAVGQTTFAAAGANPAAIQATVDNFRAALGTNNGTGGSFQVGRREVNWEDVPDNLAEPNALPFNHFNTTQARGLVVNTIANIGGNHQLRVSARAGNPTATAVRFGNVDASYPTVFQAFSGERIASGRFSATLDFRFCIPGTSIPATVGGFGIVLADVDSSNSYIEWYAPDGNKVSGSSYNVNSNGLSFLGFVAAPGTRIARVVVQLGNAPLQSGNVDGVGGDDVVAMDDVIFGEPRSMMQGAHDFDGDGGTDFTVFRPSTGQWFIGRNGGLGPTVVQWGEPGDIPVPGDYDGDRITDIAIFRPRDGGWFIAHSSGIAPRVLVWGQQGDIPVPGDYDKDGKTDVAIYRPSTGQHFLVRSSNGTMAAVPWGQPGDIPVAGRGPF
jgi:hypothetical protein